MPNYPSLAELLQAYSNTGAGDAINAATQGVTTGMNIAAQRQKMMNDQQNKLAELATQAQLANAQTSEAATKAHEAEAKFVPAEAAERITGAAPGTFGTPGTLVPTTAVDSYNAVKSANQRNANDLAAVAANKALGLAQLDAGQKLAAQTNAAHQAEQAQANRNTAGAAILDQSAKNAPGWLMSAIGNPLYSLVARHDAPSVQAYNNQQNAAQSLLQGQQPVFGKPLAPAPAPAAKADAATRYNQLAAQGLQKPDIYKQMHSEGY